VLAGDRVLEIADQIGDLVGKMLDAERARPVRQGRRSQLIAAWRAADAEIDAAGVERLEHPELLGDL
jgi:hypothetical protein